MKVLESILSPFVTVIVYALASIAMLLVAIIKVLRKDTKLNPFHLVLASLLKAIIGFAFAAILAGAIIEIIKIVFYHEI